MIQTLGVDAGGRPGRAATRPPPCRRVEPSHRRGGLAEVGDVLATSGNGLTRHGEDGVGAARRCRSHRASHRSGAVDELSAWLDCRCPSRRPRPNSALSSNKELAHAGTTALRRSWSTASSAGCHHRSRNSPWHWPPRVRSPKSCAEKLDVRRLTTARAGAGELEEWRGPSCDPFTLWSFGACVTVALWTDRGRSRSARPRSGRSPMSRYRHPCPIALCLTARLVSSQDRCRRTRLQPVQSSGAT